MEDSHPADQPLLPVCTNKALGAHWLVTAQQSTGVALITSDPHDTINLIDLPAQGVLTLHSKACQSC